MSQLEDDRARPFTLRQRRGLGVFCMLLTGAVAIGLLRNRSFIDDPIPNQAERYLELQDRVDPNEADVALLAALPALGERRASDIVEFRERSRRSGPNGIPFRRIEDLMQVRGIGTAIVEQLRPFLRFPEPTSQPAL